jgi:hypothetical protein
MKLTNLIVLIVVAFFVLGYMYSSACAQGNDHYYQTVSFPKVSLKSDRGERIDSLKVIMHCGRFAALNTIPNDWSAEVVSPVSEETTLSMVAGHGSTALWRAEDLKEFITILVCERSCFDITASMTVSYYDGQNLQEREIFFKQKELIMKRVPNKSLHPTAQGGR